MSEMALTFNVLEDDNKKTYIATCTQYPDVRFSADTKEEALIGAMGAVSTELLCVEITRLNEEIGLYDECRSDNQPSSEE